MSKQRESMNASEGRCHRLGDLAARAAGGQPPDPRQWGEIEQAMDGRQGFWRHRWLVLAIPALAGLAFWIAVGQSLGHKVQGCSPAPDGSLSAPDDRTCVVVFADGTRITLGQATRGRLRALGRHGAELVLKKGHADLSVVHRPGGRWEVLAGPFKVRVTGTRFEVDWAPGRGRFSLEVSEGEVSVNGGPLHDPTPVRAGERLEQVETVPDRVIPGGLGTGVPGTAVALPAAEAPGKIAVEAAPTPVARSGRKRGTPTSKPLLRSPPPASKAGPPVPEPPVAVLDPAARDWTASSAADDEPAPAPPGPRRLTIGKNGEVVGGVTGPIRAVSGSGTMFSKRARASAKHLYLDDGLLCTSGKMSQLACVDEAGLPKRCDWDTNWGVLIRWYTREDQKAWGSGANSSIALEFRGNSGHYRLVAHREGDPAQQAYCFENYRSGRTVTPSEFKACSAASGSRLPDFTKIDYFALQLLSEEAWLNFGFCLSAISLF